MINCSNIFLNFFYRTINRNKLIIYSRFIFC
nr:MAG TPA: hypothetical protein [Caudoviricetes sp.]